ncbi:hypothetical protein ASE82_08420 [Sphingomonas sp. Leaf230]|uniref:hypothetical protein n=1 Tax=Sphingomonas sp. Leaf230 TaxID=1735694 RepID=UPI0006F38C88|nr:hypothetical protein [Sphingomonas sp. Leaf230]KQN02373.1 hypothetical protein ASE82_08420 [Sphingomonas sp. Leaf230]
MKLEQGTAKIQAITFLAAAVAGAACIVVLKTLGVRQMIVTVAPCLVMAAYASLILGRYYRARADQIGDNLYYLGFIFTLISLSVSLSQFSSGGSAEDIVANFGIALATTLLGVTLRVVFSQMRSDPVETEKEARLQLAEASRRLKVELMNASAEFGMAARASRQSVNDVIEEMQEKLGATLDAAGERLRESVAQSASGLSGASKGLEAQIGGAATRLADASESLRAALEASTTRWDDGVRDTSDRNTEFNSVARKLSGAVDRLATRMDKGVGSVDGIELRFAALAVAAEGLEQRFVGAGLQIDGGVEAIAVLRRDAADLHHFASAASAAGQGQAASVERALGAVARAETAADTIEAQPARMVDILDEAEGRMRTVVDRAIAAVERVEREAASARPSAPDASLDDRQLQFEPFVPPAVETEGRPAV